ncbi:MAG: endolytic transglycosylase MltG [Propionibacteriaceae bacterium]|nr:endolytic transglycosylase MltG [Propionibacteriaceae bacterium]
MFDENNEVRWIGTEASRRTKSAIAVTLSFVILLGGMAVVGVKGYGAYMDWRQQDDYIGDGGTATQVIVREGVGWGTVADSLVGLDVIRDPGLFEREALKLAAGPVPGTWNILTHLPAKTAAKMMNDPDNKWIMKITMREGRRLSSLFETLIDDLDLNEDDVKRLGWTPEKIEAALAEIVADPKSIGLSKWAEQDWTGPFRGNVEIEDATKLEGFLFPDTYFFTPPIDTGVKSILARFAEEFNDVTGPKDLDIAAKAQALGYSAREIIIIASIIEAEVFIEADRPKVARVIYNRLKEDMPLQMDSVVNYGLNRSGKANLEEGNQDTETPWGVYNFSGLPLTPINSPSRSALMAAVNPAEGNWLYFVTINLDTGETLFADTYDEHVQQREIYRKWCRENPASCPD